MAVQNLRQNSKLPNYIKPYVSFLLRNYFKRKLPNYLKSNGKRKPPNYIEGRRKLPHYLTLEVLIQYHDYKGKSFAPQKISSPAMMQEYSHE